MFNELGDLLEREERGDQRGQAGERGSSPSRDMA